MSGRTRRQEMSEDQDGSGNREAGLNEGGKAPPSQRKFEPPKKTAWAAGPTLKPGAALPSIWESHSPSSSILVSSAAVLWVQDWEHGQRFSGVSTPGQEMQLCGQGCSFKSTKREEWQCLFSVE